MTKKEIIKALIKGKKITHRTFNDVQWIKLYKKQSTHYINQSGKVTQALEFWLNKKVHSNNKSGFTGVYKTKEDNWKADICVNYKKISLGTHSEIQDAVIARNNYIKENNLVGFKIQ